MLLPTLLIIAVNLALGFVVAVGRERGFALRFARSATAVDATAEETDVPPEPAPPEQPALDTPAAEVDPTAEDATNDDDADAVADSADPPQDDESTGNDSGVDQNRVDENGVDEPDATAADATSGEEASDGASPALDEAADGDATDTETSTSDAAASDAAASDAAASDANPGDDDVDTPDHEPVDDAASEPQSATVEVSVDAAASNASAELPAEWFDALADIEKEGYGKCKSFVEASTQVLRLEVGRYRGELVQLDGRIRSIYKNYDAAALAAAIAELERVNLEWLEKQGEAVGHLAARRDDLGELQSAGQRLEDVLLDQTAQIESSCTNIKQIDVAADGEGSQRRLLTEVCRLVDMAHVLRDQLQESLLAIMIGENRVATLDRRLHVDTLTGFVNRSGLEAALYEWWRDDPNRIRQLSLVMFDIAKIGRFNERHGVATGDGLLEAVGKIVDGTLRKKRGCDFVARYSGQRFVVVLGDTGPRNAASAAERIRQMIVASTFEVDGEEVEVRASCGVVEVLTTDDSRAALGRLEKTVSLAKKLGRNTTCLDEGKGAAAVENPPQFDAKGKIVRLETT